jgi:hypothetical protein
MSPPSDTRLVDWLRGVVLDPTGGELEANRARVAAITGALGVAAVLDLFTYAYDWAGDGETGFALLLASVREGEADWDTEPDAPLARRLAAAALADRLAVDDDGAVILALAVRSAAFSGQPSPLPDLPGLATQALARIATARRRRPIAETASLDEELKPVIKEITVAAEVAATTETLRAALEKTRTSLRTVARRSDAIAAEARLRHLLVDEELDILWWSQGAVSETLGISWAQAGEEATLLAALELAGLQRLQPAPRSAPRLVSTALREAGLDPRGEASLQATVEAAVEASGGASPAQVADPAWLFPVSAALEECRRKRGEKSWAPAYRSEFDLDPALPRVRFELVVQMLCERSLHALIGSPPA